MSCHRPGPYTVYLADRLLSPICGFVERVLLWGARNLGAPGVSCKNGKAPFDRLRANGSSLEIILVPSVPVELTVYSAHAEPVEAPMMNEYYEPTL